MKLKTLAALLLTGISIGSSPPVARAEGSERLEKIAQLARQGDPAEAFAEGQKYLEELRASGLQPDHPAIGLAAATVGAVASAAGHHEDAVRLLREGLPNIAKRHDGRLLVSELQFAVALEYSLEQLGRQDEAIEVLEGLIKRTREGIDPNIKGPAAILKGATDDGQVVGLDTVTPNETWLVGLLEKVGQLRSDQQQWPGAEADLKEAFAILTEANPDARARLVNLREGWEQAAREQGKAIRPLHVGRFANPREIRFRGGDSIPPAEIHSALARSSAFVLASHPGAGFDDYLKKLERCLVLGFRHAGFPDVKVSVSWLEAEDAVVAQIEEGTRFKAGEIRISGAQVLSEQALQELLIEKPGAEKPADPGGRAERTYEVIAAKKHLPPDQVTEAVRKFFPRSLQQKEQSKDATDTLGAPDFNLSSLTSADPAWKQGEWVNYQPSLLNEVEEALRSAYAVEGRFFPKFKVEWAPRPEDGVVDLAVEVVEEGPPIKLGKLHVAGNRINTDDELLGYLDLEEGVVLSGDFVGRAKRKLYDSSRFLGWEVIPYREDAKSNQIELLIIVAEQWEAPPLAQPLSREQQAFVKFAQWLNTEAGVREDLVLSVSGDTEIGPVAFRAAVGNAGVALSLDALKRHICAVGALGGQAKVVIRADADGSPFRAVFPLGGIPFEGFLVMTESALSGSTPFGPGMTEFGGNWSNTRRDDAVQTLILGIDPALMMKQAGSWEYEGKSARFEDGEMVVELEYGTVLRFDELSGRLISVSMREEDDGYSILVALTTEVGAVARIAWEVEELGRDVPNWLDGKGAASLVFLAMGYAGEVLRAGESVLGRESDEDATEPDVPALLDEILSSAGRATKRWTPLATALGDVLGSFFKKKEDPADGDPFRIPNDSEDLTAQLQAGSNLSTLLGIGFYDLLSEYLEPGSWPELVAREMLFYLDGKPLYLNQTVQTLLEDDSIGPLGCLLCARLLEKIGHPGARRFAKKAQGALDEEGFAKDWRLAIRGTAEDGGPGWKLLRVLGTLTDEQIDGFLPEDFPVARTEVKQMLAKIRAIDPKSDADALAPLMGIIWDSGLAELVEQFADETRQNLTPQVDARLVAAGVNGQPVPRGALRLMAQMPPQDAFLPGESRLEHGVTTLLLAQEIWNQGLPTMQQKVEQQALGVVMSLGPDWLEKLAQMGLSREQFLGWTGAQIAAEAQRDFLLEKAQIDEQEVRQFYERNLAHFGAGAEANVHRIMLKAIGDGAAQRDLAKQILARVKQAGDIKAMAAAFKEEGAKLGSDFFDTYSWAPADGFAPALNEAVAAVPDESVSDVIELNIRSHDYIFLILIPDKRRQGQAQPFEKVAPVARKYAILEREINLLRKRADIQTFEEPSGESPLSGQIPEQEPPAPGLKQQLAGSLAGLSGNEKEEIEPRGEQSQGLELILEKVSAGSAKHLYELGAYAELGLAPESGLGNAISNYQRAAARGDRRAMLRLSELYRTGQGVGQDQEEAQRWREKAAALGELAGSFLDAIIFEGNTVFTAKALKSLLKLEVSQINKHSLDDAVLAIEDHYRESGYVNARVVNIELRPTARENHIDLVLTIGEGERHTVSKVTLSGVSEDTLLDRLQTTSGAPYSSKAVHEDAQFLRMYYHRKGYPNVEVLPKLTNAGKTALDLDFSVSKGARSKPTQEEKDGDAGEIINQGH